MYIYVYIYIYISVNIPSRSSHESCWLMRTYHVLLALTPYSDSLLNDY